MPRIIRHFLAVCAAATVAGAAAATVAGTAAAGPASATTANRWRIAYTYRGSYGQLQSIAAVSQRDAWATGILSNSHGNLFKPFVLHWNGKTWRRAAVPGSKGYMMLSVAASSPRNVWLFADRKGSAAVTVFRWNGTRWHRASAPWDNAVVLSQRNAWSLTGVWCGSRDGKRICVSHLEHWNGHRWQKQTAPGNITRLAGTPASGIWATGTTAQGRLVAYHRTYGHWRPLHMPHPKVAAALGIAMRSARNVWISADAGHNRNFALHWNGHTWRATPKFTARLAGRAGAGILIADGRRDVWLNTRHWNGRSWTNTWRSAPSGLELYQIVKVPGTVHSYWSADLRYGSYSTHAVVGVYGPLP